MADAVLRVAGIPGRGGECFFHIPAKNVQPAIDGSIMDSGCARPLSQGFGFAIHLYAAIAALVVRLLCVCGPSTIVRLVIPVVVDALNFKTGHITRFAVSNKGRDILPTITNFNASSSVLRVANIVWLFASVLHTVPNLVQGMARHSVGRVFRFIQFATARRGVAIAQPWARYGFYSAAVASTIPLDTFTPPDGVLCDNEKLPEALSSKINSFSRHSPNLQIAGGAVNG